MSKSSTLYTLDDFKPRCWFCRGIVLSPPLYMLVDSCEMICKNCALIVKEPFRRCLRYEQMLRQFQFPCKFYKQGCDVLVHFNRVEEHEDGCLSRIVSCPCHECLWKGEIPLIPIHFQKDHLDIMRKQTSQFQLDLNENVQSIFMCTHEKQYHTIVKYAYSHSTKKLHYDIRYFPNELREVTCRTRITTTDHHSVTFKEFVCDIFNVRFYCMEDAKIIDLNHYSTFLGDPNLVTVSLDIAIHVPKQPHLKRSRKKHFEEFVQLSQECMKCDWCKERLIPPTHICDGQILCKNCWNKDVKKCDPLKNLKSALKTDFTPKRSKQLTFHCPWAGCQFSGKNIEQHQSKCRHRVCECIESNCQAIFKFEESMEHFTNHGYKFFNGNTVFKVKLTEDKNLKMVTHLNDLAVCFYFQIDQKKLLYNGTRAVEMVRHDRRFFCPDAKFQLVIQHKHCELKSRTFAMSKCSKIGIKQLPGCFLAYEELTVSLNNFKLVTG